MQVLFICAKTFHNSSKHTQRVHTITQASTQNKFIDCEIYGDSEESEKEGSEAPLGGERVLEPLGVPGGSDLGDVKTSTTPKCHHVENHR